MANQTKLNIVQSGNNNTFSFEYKQLNITDQNQYVGITTTSQSEEFYSSTIKTTKYYLNSHYDNIIEVDCDNTNRKVFDRTSDFNSNTDYKIVVPYDNCLIHIPDSYANTDFLVQIGIENVIPTYKEDGSHEYVLIDNITRINLFSSIIPSTRITQYDTPIKLNSITYNKGFVVPIPAIHLFSKDTVLDLTDNSNTMKPVTGSTTTLQTVSFDHYMMSFITVLYLVIVKRDKLFELVWKDIPENWNLIQGYEFDNSIQFLTLYYLIKYRKDVGLEVDSVFDDFMTYAESSDYKFDDETKNESYFSPGEFLYLMSIYSIQYLADNYEFYVKINPIKYNDDLTITYLGDETTSYFTMFSSSEIDDLEGDSSIKCKLSTTNLTETDQSKFGLLCKLEYDEQYSSIKDWLQNYTSDEITEGSVQYILEFKDSENIYYTEESNKIELSSKSYKNYFYPSFDSWDYYTDGMYCDIKCIISYNDKQVVLTSNKINITPSIYRFFVEGLNYGGKKIYNIDINKIPDVQIIDIQAVNKVVNKVVQMSRSTDYKSNIQKPVYIKTQPTDSITLHSNVNENVCINLDTYKSSTNLFLLKIDGTSYTEIGRISSGIIFKVNCSLEVGTNGTYYIIDQENNLITTGTYKII